MAATTTSRCSCARCWGRAGALERSVSIPRRSAEAQVPDLSSGVGRRGATDLRPLLDKVGREDDPRQELSADLTHCGASDDCARQVQAGTAIDRGEEVKTTPYRSPALAPKLPRPYYSVRAWFARFMPLRWRTTRRWRGGQW